MPTIFADVRKKNAQMVGGSEESEPKEGMSVLNALGKTMLDAFKENDVEKLVSALKAFHLECSEYEED